MPDRAPRPNPAGWFLEMALVILIGTIALWVAVHLLSLIWPWLLLIAGVISVCWLAVIAARLRRQRW